MKTSSLNLHLLSQTMYLFLILHPTRTLASNHPQCEDHTNGPQQSLVLLIKYKLAAIASILLASALGISIPLIFKNIHALQPEKPVYFLVKAFAAGVILATGFIHILPDAFASLTSPCLGKRPWGDFPMAGFIAMAAAIGILMMESFATGFHKRAELRKAQPVDVDEDEESDVGNCISTNSGHVHSHHGPNSVPFPRSNSSSDLIRNRIISQVLELGIVIHSVIIGISLGANGSSKTIKSLIIALSFHQFFEGMGLGGCISQAKYKTRTIVVMVVFFALTAPTGIAMGIVMSASYNEHQLTALIVEGVLTSASAGILIYMALVDLLAADFMNTKLQKNLKILLGAHATLLLGACCMSILAKWGGA